MVKEAVGLLEENMPAAEVERGVKQAVKFLKGNIVKKAWRTYLPPDRCALSIFRGTGPRRHFPYMGRGGATAMNDPDRVKLLFGPYRPPALRRWPLWKNEEDQLTRR